MHESHTRDGTSVIIQMSPLNTSVFLSLQLTIPYKSVSHNSNKFPVSMFLSYGDSTVILKKSNVVKFFNYTGYFRKENGIIKWFYKNRFSFFSLCPFIEEHSGIEL
uniref:Uncharacterized protein n=1 Tax=Clytia hemisphaerica TaxID=252671 RepID=A0A7M5X6L5_9CNID